MTIEKQKSHRRSGSGTRPISAALILVLLTLCVLSGCGTPTERDAKATRSYTDSAGRTVEIPVEAEHIAPSGTYAQMFLLTLCPEKLIGLSSALTRSQKQFLPEYLTTLPTFGQFYGGSGTVNYEEIIAAAPDLIIDIGEKKDTIVEDMDGIQAKTGIPVIFLESSLLNIPETYTALGEVTGSTERAEELAAYSRDVLTTVQQTTALLSDTEKPRVYVGDGEYGTEASPAGSVHSEVMDLLGAINVAQLEEYSDSGKKEVPMEQILLWNPEVVFLTTDANYDEIYEDPVWASVQAVKDHRVYEIPSSPYNWIDRPPSVQRILGLLWMGSLLYPERYGYDMVGKTQEYYQLFYQYDLTEQEAEALLSHSTLQDQGNSVD